MACRPTLPPSGCETIPRGNESNEVIPRTLKSMFTFETASVEALSEQYKLEINFVGAKCPQSNCARGQNCPFLVFPIDLEDASDENFGSSFEEDPCQKEFLPIGGRQTINLKETHSSSFCRRLKTAWEESLRRQKITLKKVRLDAESHIVSWIFLKRNKASSQES